MSIIQDVQGTGPTKVVVISGWFGRESLYAAMLQGIDLDAFALAFVDFRGYGARKDVEGVFDLAEIAGDVSAGVDELGWSSFGLVGHSMGGPVAALAASALAGRVTGYLGVSPAPPAGTPFDADTRAFFTQAAESAEVRAQIISMSTGNLCPTVWSDALAARSMREADPVAFAKYFEAWVDADAGNEFGGLEIPIRLVVGQDDLAITRELVESTYGKLRPASEIKVLADCGHYAMVESPLRLAAEIQDFFKAGAAAPTG